MYDIIVIGGGPAGLTAALYALRSGKSVMVLESNIVGGQIANSPKLENFPTIQAIPGINFAMQFAEQVEAWGGVIEYDEVVDVRKKDGYFSVMGNYGEHQAKAVIVATGVSHKHINVPGEQELLGKGIYYCALCDGPLFKGKEVALIGDGNTAMQYALSLSNICSKVYLLTWMDKFFGDVILEKIVRNTDNIIHMPNTSVKGFSKEDEKVCLVYEDAISGAFDYLTVPGVFVAIGQVPHNEMFVNLATLDRQGYFVANEDMSTTTPGLFVAGDCRAKKMRQVVTATSDGAIAAMSACQYIDTIDNAS